MTGFFQGQVGKKLEFEMAESPQYFHKDFLDSLRFLISEAAMANCVRYRNRVGFDDFTPRRQLFAERIVCPFGVEIGSVLSEDGEDQFIECGHPGSPHDGAVDAAQALLYKRDRNCWLLATPGTSVGGAG